MRRKFKTCYDSIITSHCSATVETQPTEDNELRTGNVGERTLEFESEVFLIENVQSFTGDDERSSTWTVTSTVILGHHARILHTHKYTRIHTDRARQTDRLVVIGHGRICETVFWIYYAG